MPRATRYLEEGYIYHLTHRCVNGEFLLRFKAERDAYRGWLRVGAKRHGVPVLGYSITCNHVHIVAEVNDRHAVGAMMQLAAGVVGQARNRRKGREGSVWEHPYHCTRIQDGRHLLNCLRYIDLNMVRAGKVSHPRDWRWCAYDELTGKRRRYRIVDQERLLHLAAFSSADEFFRYHADSVDERLHAGENSREPCWTEGVAVGNEEFVEEAEAGVTYRQAMHRYRLEDQDGDAVWVVREAPGTYMPNSAPESSL